MTSKWRLIERRLKNIQCVFLCRCAHDEVSKIKFVNISTTHIWREDCALFSKLSNVCVRECLRLVCPFWPMIMNSQKNPGYLCAFFVFNANAIHCKLLRWLFYLLLLMQQVNWNDDLFLLNTWHDGSLGLIKRKSYWDAIHLQLLIRFDSICFSFSTCSA